MAKASRVTARQAKALEQIVADMAEINARLQRIERKVDALSKKTDLKK